MVSILVCHKVSAHIKCRGGSNGAQPRVMQLRARERTGSQHDSGDSVSLSWYNHRARTHVSGQRPEVLGAVGGGGHSRVDGAKRATR